MVEVTVTAVQLLLHQLQHVAAVYGDINGTTAVAGTVAITEQQDSDSNGTTVVAWYSSNNSITVTETVEYQ